MKCKQLTISIDEWLYRRLCSKVGTRANYAAFSGDGRRLVMSSPTDAHVRVWDVQSGKLTATLVNKTTDKPPQQLVALNADGKKLAIFQPLTNGLGIFAVDGESTSPNLHTKMPADGLAFAPTGELLVWANAEHEDATGKMTVRSELQVFFPADPKRKPFEAACPPSLNGIAFRPDGHKVLLLVSGPVDEPAPKKEADLK